MTFHDGFFHHFNEREKPMDQGHCLLCDKVLRPSDKKASRTICGPCTSQKRVTRLLSDDFLAHVFATIWARGFFLRLSSFLQQQETPIESQDKILAKALKLFQEAENTFHRPEEMNEESLQNMIFQTVHGLLTTFFLPLLIQN